MFVEFQGGMINTSQINYVTKIHQNRNGSFFFEVEFVNRTVTYENQIREELEKLHEKLVNKLPK